MDHLNWKFTHHKVPLIYSLLPFDDDMLYTDDYGKQVANGHLMHGTMATNSFLHNGAVFQTSHLILELVHMK